MPSLFSRTRTTSTPQKRNNLNSDENYGLGSSDEFGRVSSRLSNRGVTLGTPLKKDKKKDQKHQKTFPSGREESEQPLEPQFPDGAFLPLNLEKPRTDNNAPEYLKEHDYGYLSYERHVVLGIEQVERLVEVISEELETRGGVTTPFIFSTTALDISSSAIKRLIRSFISSCEPFSGQKAQEAEAKWREEARFAEPHELGMCLRWGLARVIRSVGGQDVRGLVSWEHYVDFRDSEAALRYPPTHFATQFLPPLPPPLQHIILLLLTLLARLVANSTSSGHTPPTLSPLFGPLFFGLGPATLAFHHAYIHYLRAVSAMEHLILAFVRWQDTPRMSVSSAGLASNPSASASSLGVPVRLKEWIKGYPSMLPSFEQKKPQPRRGARTIRVTSVRRNVRMYSPDLVKTASTWAYRPPGSNVSNGLAASKEWDRIAPATLKLAPRYSEGYKKRMDMPANFHPDVSPGTAMAMRPSQSTSSYLSTISTSTTNSLLPDSDYFGLSAREGEDKFRSLTDLKWGEFESMGFGGLGDEKKLQFDLTESARTERSAKRQTLSWNDFSSAGFSRMDAPLSATLQFSTPLTNTISTWPAQSAEMNKKLKKAQKQLPAFGWDTEPVVGSEEVIEEAFLDVFCDLIYGGGWMDLERGEVLDRDCNWALVEYKSLPPSRTTASGGADPRTTTALLLFEEFVPLEYREQLAVKSSNRRRLPSLFSASGKKSWKQAPTLNGRPYVVGHVPHSPSIREVEFEGLLHGTTSTKVLSLNPKNSRIQTPVTSIPPQPLPPPQATPAVAVKKTPAPVTRAEPEIHTAPKSDELHSDSTASPSVKKSLFRLPATPGSNRRSMIPAAYSSVDFETRMASYSDDDESVNPNEPEDVKQKRRESSADAWVDILVGSQSRRMDGQEAEFSGRKRGPANRGLDPDDASLEVAQVLAAVQNRAPSPSSVMERVDQDYGMDQHYSDDFDIDEVETVPRTSNVTDDYESESGLAYDESEMDHRGDSESPPEVGVMNAREMARHQRRVGYFDLHPERRKATQSMIDEENIRAKLSHDDSEDEDEDESQTQIHSVVEIRPLPVPPVAPVVQQTIHEPIPQVPAKSTVATLNQSPEMKSENAVAPLTPAVNNGLPATPSKTAALIEMYRERERGSSPNTTPLNVVPIVIAPLAPSRLPVRTASLPKENVSLAQPPLLAATASPKVSPRPSPSEPSTIELPHIPLEETGRNSPARYQHGAPLQNVIEEEEE
ncbi:hypothetical protein CVT25_015316 [Psilocybe cyanescens]|uniref:Meiotically up-regulated protein Msb1/Mug8 domain-containing protein n=1 Tax=Psilocybe cyanescens TaxID=93625 RepID=A0A409WH34_PSICY|nr:hypothetical protein CVT25_015316 [Psilocybe cyanescens]